MKNCGLCPSRPVRKSGSLKKQWSSKRHTDEIEQNTCREWPVVPELYELLQFAGKGAHAVVYKGRCRAYDEVVAIKRLDLDCNWDLTALIREATLMKKFNHPAVLPLYAAFVAGKELWFVTPFMGMGSVRSVMKQHYPLGLDEVIIATIMQPVLLALEYVHRNNGIHRDVKADNILVSEEGEVVLADFGVASARMRQVSMVNMDVQAVMATTFVGTPCWMAPEVMLQSGDGYHTSADIWSFGITLIELAHGRPPLARMNPLRVLMDTMNKPPPQLGEREEGVQFSKPFRELVEECLNKDPCLRPTAAALLNHRFFRMAQDAAFLKQHFLLPAIEQQQQQQRQQRAPGQPQQHPSPAASAAAESSKSPAAAEAAAPAATAAPAPAEAAAPATTAVNSPTDQQGPASPAQQQQSQQQQQQPQQVVPSPLGLFAGRVCGAVRAASGFFSGHSISGPSRLSSGWVFPLTAANSSQLGSCSRNTSLAPEQVGINCSCSGSSYVAPLAAGHSLSLEQQLQPFLLQQQQQQAGLLAAGSCGAGSYTHLSSSMSAACCPPGGCAAAAAKGYEGIRVGSSSSRQFVVPASNTVLESHAEDVTAEEEALAAAAVTVTPGAAAVVDGSTAAAAHVGGSTTAAAAVAAGVDESTVAAAEPRQAPVCGTTSTAGNIDSSSCRSSAECDTTLPYAVVQVCSPQGNSKGPVRVSDAAMQQCHSSA